MPTSSFGLDVFAGRDTRVVAARGRLVAGAGGIGRLLLARQALAGRGAHLTIAAATPRVWRVLELTGLDRVLAPGRDPRDREDAAADITSAAGTLCRCA
jgi:hypothetical protein